MEPTDDLKIVPEEQLLQATNTTFPDFSLIPPDKRKLIQEGSELHEHLVQLKLKSSDGKYYKTDVLNTNSITNSHALDTLVSTKINPSLIEVLPSSW